MNIEALHQLQEQAVEAARTSGKIEDIATAASITKEVLDAEKSVRDTLKEPRLFRYEEFKTWATLFVPFLSILTLALTVYMQMNQLQETRAADEDKRWIETVKNVLDQMYKSPAAVPDPSISLALLEPYANKERFGPDARRLGVELLARVPSSDLFKNYFFSHHVGESWSDEAFMTDLNRELFTYLPAMEQQQPTSMQDPNAAETFGLQHDVLVAEIEFVSGKLAGLYRKHPESTSTADFRNVFLLNTSLRGMNLSETDFSGAKLQNVDLSDATLGGKFEDAAFTNSHWWNAREISPPLLQYLLEVNYPYYAPKDVPYDQPVPSKEAYVQKVLNLCRKAEIKCSREELRYGEAPTSSEKGIKDQSKSSRRKADSPN